MNCEDELKPIQDGIKAEFAEADKIQATRVVPRNIVWCNNCQVQHQEGWHTKPMKNENKLDTSLSQDQITHLEIVAENRGFNTAVNAIYMAARQLLGPQHKVMEIIKALKGN